jgi:hypothetical protein
MVKRPHPVVRMVSGPGTGTIWWVCPVCKRVPGWRNTRHTPRCNGTHLHWPIGWQPIPDQWLTEEELRRRNELRAQPHRTER